MRSSVPDSWNRYIDYSNPILLRIRLLLGGKLGVLRPIVRGARRARGYKYEDAFDAALMASVSPEDTVWDVGANEGHYTDKFSNRAESGIVVGFEPSPRTFARLQQRFKRTPNVWLENVALTDREGEESFFLSDNSAEDSLFRQADQAVSEVKVRAVKGDSFAKRFPPDVIKIDVEGFEWEVLKGMNHVLTLPRLRRVFVEVHFSILADRGLVGAPREIVRRLECADLRVEWLDPSHLVGRRD